MHVYSLHLYSTYTLLVPLNRCTLQTTGYEKKHGVESTFFRLDLLTVEKKDALIWNLRAGGWPFSLVIQVPEEPGGIRGVKW